MSIVESDDGCTWFVDAADAGGDDDDDDIFQSARNDRTTVRLLETDVKSMSGLSTHSAHSSARSSTHSRHSSSGSVISSNSIQSHVSNPAAEDETAANQEEDSWLVWGQVVNDWETYAKKKPAVIRDLVRKGIPCHFRGIVWQLLCNAFNSPHKDQYAEYIKQTSPCEKVIRRDIARTYPEHEFFKEKDGVGQESLFNVIKAYSLHDREVGYCQGSGFIVGLLLMQMPEEEAYSVLVKLMQDYDMREMFKPSMAKLGLCMYQLECMVQEQLPELNMHFQSQSFYTSMYASSWFLTLFTTTLPVNFACKIMDVFISEGLESIFRISMAILFDCKSELMSLDMEGMLKFFQKEMPDKYANDPDRLLNLSYQVKFNSKKMKKLEKEYTAMKSKEAEEQIELRRLRTENRLLRQRLEMLEQESISLADRLIQGQVIRAQEAEESFQLKRELSVMRQISADTQDRLAETQTHLDRLLERQKQNEGSSGLTLQQAEEMIQTLQQELVSVRLREAESTCTIKELKARIEDLEESNRHMRSSAPCNQVATLQEELIAVKLREAEANLSMKELRQKVADLEQTWQKHMTALSGSSKKEANNKNSMQQVYNELMTVKIREAESLAELKEMRQRVMELETQSQMSSNQLKRADDEQQVLKEQCSSAVTNNKELHERLREAERRYSDLESKRREEVLMSRLREAELSTTIAELRQQIAELEIGKQELVTEDALKKDDEVNEIKELQAKITDLQTEVVQLRIDSKLHSSQSLDSISSTSRLTVSVDVDDDDEKDLVAAITSETRSPTLEALAAESPHRVLGTTTSDAQV